MLVNFVNRQREGERGGCYTTLYTRRGTPTCSVRPDLLWETFDNYDYFISYRMFIKFQLGGLLEILSQMKRILDEVVALLKMISIAVRLDKLDTIHDHSSKQKLLIFFFLKSGSKLDQIGLEFVDVEIEIGIFLLEKLERLDRWMITSEERIFEVLEKIVKSFAVFSFYRFVLTCWKLRGKIYRFCQVNRIFVEKEISVSRNFFLT